MRERGVDSRDAPDILQHVALAAHVRQPLRGRVIIRDQEQIVDDRLERRANAIDDPNAAHTFEPLRQSTITSGSTACEYRSSDRHVASRSRTLDRCSSFPLPASHFPLPDSWICGLPLT